MVGGFRGRHRHKQVLRETFRWRVQSNRFAFEMKDGDGGGCTGKNDSIVRRGADRIVGGLYPFEASQGKPAVWFEKVPLVLFAPRGDRFVPGRQLASRSLSRHRKQQSHESH